MQRPAVGRIVHVLVDEATNRGQDYAPAIITHVHEDGTIDVHVTPGGPCFTFRGIPLLAERPTPSMREWRASFMDTEPTIAWWPPRS